MDKPYNFKKELQTFDEGAASEHPDIQNQPDFQRRADEILEKRKRDRNPSNKKAKKVVDFLHKSKIKKEEFELDEKTQDHEYSMARGELNTASDSIQRLKKRLKGEGQLEAWVQSKITKATDYLRSASDYIESGESQVNEEHMTKSYIKKEEKLKKKYDPSGMKASMIKQYGPVKGKQIYFATIRKQAMKESLELDEMQVQDDIEDEQDKFHSHQQISSAQNYVRELEKRKRRQKLIQKAREVANAVEQEGLDDDYNYELDEAKLSRAERRAGNAGKKGYDAKGNPTTKGGVHAFDVDETLFSHGVKGKPNVKVHVNDPSGKRIKSLTNQEFNTHKLPKDHSYDFSEFRSSKKFSQTASPNKSVISKIKRLQRRRKDVHLITARDKFDNPKEFRQHFERHGISLKPGQIHYAGGMKGSDIGQKKVAIAKGLSKIGKTSSVHMYDDAAKVHKAFEAEKPGKLKIKTHLAKPNKRGEVMLRSYQATKEEFELWVNALIDEGYDLSDFTTDELIEAYSETLDEAITAVAAPGEEDKPKRPIKKGPKPLGKGLKYKSPYPKDKKLKEEKTIEVTPYEFWKSFIGEDSNQELEEENIEETVEIEEKASTSYDYWKSVIEEQASFQKTSN